MEGVVAPASPLLGCVLFCASPLFPGWVVDALVSGCLSVVVLVSVLLLFDLAAELLLEELEELLDLEEPEGFSLE